LWPDSDAWLARRALNTAIYRLRLLLGRKEAVTLNDDSIALDPQLCWVDAWAFEQALAESRDPFHLRSVLRLYRGMFLCEADHPLAFETRERLRRKFVQAVLQVGHGEESLGDTGAAIRLYDFALDTDCTSEDLHRALMRCLAREGNPSAVGAAYKRCRTMLWRHYAINPSPATEQVYRDAAGRYA
jgi:DNA-binding SARP family transcriptional activator